MKRNLLFLLFILFVSSAPSFAQSYAIKFTLHTRTHTPEDETIVIYTSWAQFYPLKKVGDNDWETTLNFYNGTKLNYYYCRNYMSAGVGEAEFNSIDGYRQLTVTENLSTVADTVYEWKWWPIDGVVPDIDYSLHLSESPEIKSDSDFQCGVELPDFWWEQFEPVVESTLDLIVKNSNSTWVQYAPVPEITQYYPTPIIDMYGNNGTPDDALVDIITSAHKRGLKFFLRPFQWALFVTDESAQDHSDEWWNDYSDQWLPIITHYAILSEEHGVEMIDLSLWNAGGETRKPFLDSLLCNMVDTVRSVYTGKLSMELNPWGAKLDVYSKVDYLSFKLWDNWPITLSNAKDPTVSEMLEVLRVGLDNLFKPWYDKYDKKLVFAEIAAGSLDGSVNGSASVWQNEYWDPIDENTKVDLQEQADVHEAMLQAITEREWIAGAYSFSYNYWNSVDKTPSIRNKPAEKVLAKWWRWITPDKRHLTLKCSDGGNTIPSAASYVLNSDTTVTIAAQPDEGHFFSHWSGDVIGIDSLNPNQEIVLNEDKQIKAVFIQIPTGNENYSNLQADFVLHQCYPNPFNTSTTIEYTILSSKKVILTIFDIFGREVAKLVDEVKHPGKYSVIFNGSNLAEGTYFYRIHVGDFTATKKIILLK